jgi:hypothetical protein
MTFARCGLRLLQVLLLAVPLGVTSLQAFAQGISPKDYGACGDNICDDTNAINQWLTAISAAHAAGTWPAGTYKITAPLVVITTGSWAVHGAGGYQTVLNYAGPNTATDIWHIGSSSGLNSIELSGFRITSAVAMTSGSCLHLDHVAYSYVHDVNIDTNVAGNKNCYDGIFFDSSSWNWYDHSNVYCSHYCVKADSGAELSIDQFQCIAPGDTCIYLGGGFGGLYCGYCSMFGGNSGEVGLRVDTQLTGTGNAQIFLSNRTVFDNFNAASIYLADPIPSNKSLSFDGWASSCRSTCAGSIDIIAFASGNIQVGGGAQFLSNGGSAIYDADPSVMLTIDPAAMLGNNAGYGVNCVVPVSQIVLGTTGTNNAAGLVSGNCHGQKLMTSPF